MSLIAFRRGRDQAGRWKDGQLQEEPPPPPSEPSPVAADPGEDARSFYESLLAEGSGSEPSRSHRDPPVEAADPPRSPDSSHFCRTCGASFRDPPARHRRSTAHLLGLGAPPAPPGYRLPLPRSSPGYRLLLRAGWAGGGLGRAGHGRLLPVPTELKRDRTGLGWGPAARPRITHFGAGDAAAVAGPPPGRGAAAERNRAGRGEGSRCRFRSEAAARAWEIRLREYMERWDPPEPPKTSPNPP